MAARYRDSADDLMLIRLHIVCTQQWRMPKAVTALVLGAMLESRSTRATELRQALATSTGMHEKVRPDEWPWLFTRESLRPLLAQFSPEFFVQLCEDARAEGVLTRQQSSAVQEAILGCVDRTGQWRPVEEEVPHGPHRH